MIMVVLGIQEKSLIICFTDDVTKMPQVINMKWRNLKTFSDQQKNFKLTKLKKKFDFLYLG